MTTEPMFTVPPVSGLKTMFAVWPLYKSLFNFITYKIFIFLFYIILEVQLQYKFHLILLLFPYYNFKKIILDIFEMVEYYKTEGNPEKLEYNLLINSIYFY